MIEVQLTAVALVLEVLGGRSLSTVLASAKTTGADLSASAGLSGSDWGAIQDVAYGVFRRLRFLRAVLAQLLSKPLIDDDIEALLLVSLYQLESTRAAPHAVVNDAVEACVRLRKTSAKGLVNAVLRAFLRRRGEVLAGAGNIDATRLSYPDWWIDVLKLAYPDCYAEILEAGNAHPPMTLRVNQRLISRDAYHAMLRDNGIASEAASQSALILERPVAVERLPGFNDGLVSVQDLTAQYAAPLLDAGDGSRILDACSAPGGKCAHLLELADVDVTAIDNASERLQRVQATLDRLRLRARLVCADAADVEQWWDGVAFDRILLDAPCTASGIVRRHPDIKWLRRPEDIAGLAAQQARLLSALWQTLSAGGKLLYATCSIFPAENQAQIAAFLQAHPDARWSLPAIAGVRDLQGQILPDSRHDGFFYALLQKI